MACSLPLPWRQWGLELAGPRPEHLPQRCGSTPPTAPTGLSLTRATPTQLSFRWTASTDNGCCALPGLRGTVQGRRSLAPASPLGDPAVDELHHHRPARLDAAKNKSAASAPPVATTTHTPPTRAPTVPGGLKLDCATATSLAISWTASTDNVGVTGYQVHQRRLGGHRHQPEVPDDRPHRRQGLCAQCGYGCSGQCLQPAAPRSASTLPPAPWR